MKPFDRNNPPPTYQMLEIEYRSHHYKRYLVAFAEYNGEGFKLMQPDVSGSNFVHPLNINWWREINANDAVSDTEVENDLMLNTEGVKEDETKKNMGKHKNNKTSKR